MTTILGGPPRAASTLLRLLLCLASPLALPARSAAAAAPFAPEYLRLFNDFTAQKPNPSKVGSVASLGLLRDAGMFELDGGTLALCTPVAGRVRAAVYSGAGRFVFTPPTEFERAALQRALKKQRLDMPLKGAVFLFCDSTLDYLESQVAFATGAAPAGSEDMLSRCLEDLVAPAAQELDDGLTRALLEGRQSGFFYAELFPLEGPPVIYEMDPSSYEPCRLLRRSEASRLPGHKRELDVVCQFFPGGETDTSAGFDIRPAFLVPHCLLDCNIASGGKFSATASLGIKPVGDNQHWIGLDLCPDMEVDSARWEDGSPAPLARGHRARMVWVYSDPPLQPEHMRTLSLAYHGGLLQESELGWSFACDWDWFPREPGNTASTFDITYHVADRFQLASVGEKQSEQRQGGVVTSHWVSTQPIWFVGFNIGVFKESELTAPGLPPVTVQMSRMGHQVTAADLEADEDAAPAKNMDQEVGADVMNSLSLFQHMFGPVDLKRLYVTETPEAHGLGYPGMIHLAAATFLANTIDGFNQQFRAHEVSHQWWGNAVRPRTYHDLWLQEGFADFCGAWYMQATLHDNKKYFQMLDGWRRDIQENRKYQFGQGQEASPIWAGARTETSATRGDYSLTIYEKGAWVLHMLRNMMLDLRTMEDTGFTATLREFYQTYAGHSATTDDFERIAEKHMGEDLGWFFREWVYQSQIPHYSFAWNAAAPAAGQVRVSCRVEQTGVPEDFQMYVPIRVEFSGDRFALLRVRITGPHSEFDLPLMPEKPERVEFNPLSSVLCDVQTVDWK